MDYGIVIKTTGKLLILESLLMVPSFFLAILNGGNDRWAFLKAIIIAFILGFILNIFSHKEDEDIKVEEALMIVASSWVLLSLVGALPLYFSKSTPSYIDGLFEIVSGFTATGASLLVDVEGLPKSIIFWRSFTQWIGGVGILIFTLSLLPILGVGGYQIFKAESTGPVASKITPKLRDTGRVLYSVYISLTIIQTLLLLLGGMDLFDALIYTFGTVGTGGLATKTANISYYQSPYIHMVVAIFMLVSGVNFTLYYYMFKSRWDDVIKDEEFRLYILIILVASLAITINLYKVGYGSITRSLKDSFFHVNSVMTTTGYYTVDYDTWPTFSKAILFFLMIIGGSAGSTAGGIKVVRLVIFLKLIKNEILKIFHPKIVRPIKLNGNSLSRETIDGVSAFMALYILIFVFSVIFISLEDIDLITAISSISATLGNVGFGFGEVGPTGTFLNFKPISKLWFSILMILGRLELFTVIALIIPKKFLKIN